MVAYSFQRRFAPPIAALTKRQTIRADRRRHARPGEMLQLFTGMRTRHCVKIIADPRCTSVEPVILRMDDDHRIAEVEIAGEPIDDVDGFAIRDGFESLSDMSGFWVMSHGPMALFRGVLILWEPQEGGAA
ncbi:ASCH domain-containing protein [Paenirhodobacter populi]|uniref:ASCH domain-containing protein n=1 Tax=Paenirhodobacter populi TaxID=2306993 RepID=A0A443J1L5_9RHOB|nr:ASCH domain-containing protein [Sinirhodobacter populi]RWR14236.1 ASCH domain-containing protein [Sinirhodobacter populi]